MDERLLSLDDAPLAIEDTADGGAARTLTVGGASVALDELGPIIVALDGQLSRISNWAEMTEQEQKVSYRRIAKRNAERVAALRKPAAVVQPRESGTVHCRVLPTRPLALSSGPVALPVLGFGGVIICADEFADPQRCKEFVTHAVRRGATYIDVAPEYGDGVSQARLGPALEGLREQCFLACKTMFRDAIGAEKDLQTSLAALRTEYLDLYQMHSITTKEDVDEALAPGGALETFKKYKELGVVRHLGFSAHDEEQALRLIATGEFETILFPVNFAAVRHGGFGAQVLAAAVSAGMAVLALKSYAKCRLKPSEGIVALDLGGTLGPPVGDATTIKHIPQQILATYKRDYAVVCHPKFKCWYEPEADPAWAEKLHRWTLAQPGVVSALAPGNAEMFEMGERHRVYDACGINRPF